MYDDKQPERAIVIPKGKFTLWFENFWYHYKWTTIAVLAGLFILLVCILQTCETDKTDVVMVYAGPTQLTAEQSDQISLLLSNKLPEDYDGNGERLAVLSSYWIYSEEQIKALPTDAVDRPYNTSQYSTYSNYLQTGESSIYLLDPWLFEELKNTQSSPLCPLSDVLDEVPEDSLDGYGVRLGDTELYQKYKVLQELPEDTVVCLFRQYVVGKSSKDKFYQFQADTFAELVKESQTSETN